MDRILRETEIPAFVGGVELVSLPVLSGAFGTKPSSADEENVLAVRTAAGGAVVKDAIVCFEVEGEPGIRTDGKIIRHDPPPRPAEICLVAGRATGSQTVYSYIRAKFYCESSNLQVPPMERHSARLQEITV
ncbi:NADH dehydrogenase ubiquinone flavoprotein 1, mitochondrial-like isoform X1 [Arapaima gigas]